MAPKRSKKTTYGSVSENENEAKKRADSRLEAARRNEAILPEYRGPYPTPNSPVRRSIRYSAAAKGSGLTTPILNIAEAVLSKNEDKDPEVNKKNVETSDNNMETAVIRTEPHPPLAVEPPQFLGRTEQNRAESNVSITIESQLISGEDEASKNADKSDATDKITKGTGRADAFAYDVITLNSNSPASSRASSTCSSIQIVYERVAENGSASPSNIKDDEDDGIANKSRLSASLGPSEKKKKLS